MNATKVKAVIVPDDGDRLYTIEEAAARLHISEVVMGKLLDRRLIIPIKKKNRRYVRKYAMNVFLESIEGEDLYELAGIK